MYYKKKALVLIAILVVAATLSIPANISHATAQTQTQQTPQQMYVFDLLDKPIPMRLEAINDPTSKTAATVQRFAINQSNVVELTQGGDFVAKGTNDDQILKVTFTDLNGDNPVQLTQKSPPNSYYWSLAGISPGQYLCHVTTMVSQNNVEAIFGTKSVILASGQAPGFSSSITPPAFSSRVTPPGEQQQPIIPGVIQVPGQGQGQQQQPEPITPEITQGQGQQQPEQAALQGPVVDGFKADGTVNSVIFTPGTKWIATGNWSMFAGNGKMISFITDMTWYNNNGTGSHTHEFQKFVPIGVNVTLGSDNSLHLNGLMDVGTNSRVVWKNVHSVIDIRGGRALSISVNDQETKNHFAGQPIYGVVTSMIRCSDEPGPNMEVLPPCSPS